MTPKEKAEELFDKYDSFLYKEYDNLEAKKCALIAVDEILNELFEMAIVTGSSYVHKHIDYYQEVKQEIENNK
jgi:methionine synthase II (cobalamin-independent)